MTKHKTLHFFWAAFPLSLLILLLQVMPALAQRAAGKTDSITTWTGGPNLPGPLVRAVGVLFPANSHFYAVGGRSSDVAGSDSTNPFDYNPTTNMWTTVTATFPDNMMNNMACGVLTVGGIPQIYCVGGSAAGGTRAPARVFPHAPRPVYSPTTPWPIQSPPCRRGPTGRVLLELRICPQFCRVVSQCTTTSSTFWAGSTST